MKYRVGEKVRYLGDIYVVSGGMHNEITTIGLDGEKHESETMYDLRPTPLKTEDDYEWEYDVPESDIEPFDSCNEDENEDDYDEDWDDDEYYFVSNSEYILENGVTAKYHQENNELITDDGIHIPAHYYECSGECKLSSSLNIRERKVEEEDKKDLSLKSDNGEYEINIKTTPHGIAVYGNFPENLEKDLSDIIKKMGDILND